MFSNFISKKITIIVFTILLSGALAAQQHKREMRAVWIATVANIDWPSQRNLSPFLQRQEMRKMLDDLQKNKINSIIVQVRPTADAFYASMYEPWSFYLTGHQGQKPNPFYDPLQFIIEEAHKRCIEVHAWLNPYRVTNSENADINKEHLFYKRRDLFVRYGGKYYFDPGWDETREFLNKVVGDIVERYDVDAIHFDDYFYPYKVAGEEFPDDASFAKNPRGYSPSQKGDWRRNNVNMVIAELQQTIKSIKPWVEFGISPFGVWRNDSSDLRGSATKAGTQNYDDLYADILKWLDEGSIDYVVPQLYWEIGKKVADYQTLVKWWSENSNRKNLYIGLFASALGDPDKGAAWKKGNELARQLQLNNNYPQVDGAVFYSAKPFLKNKQGLLDTLKNNYYKYPAIWPANRNINGVAAVQPENIRVLKDGNEAYLMWDKVDGEDGNRIACYVVYAFKGKKVGDMNDAANIIALTPDNCLDLKTVDRKIKGRYTFVVTAINRYKNESTPTHGITRRM